MVMRKRKRRSFIFRVILTGFLTSSVVLTFYILSVARLVIQKMEGRIWELPSRVFASPPSLYPGALLLEKDLLEYLGRLGYQKIPKRPIQTGQWLKQGSLFEIGLRPFRDLSGTHEPIFLTIDLSEDKVVSLSQRFDGNIKQLFEVTLEPEQIGEFFGDKREERTVLSLGDVPKALQQGILLMEDREFYSHHGVSFRGTLRALWANVRGGKVVQGGSTLTQQLMKNFFLSPERTFTRKLREALMTLVAEKLYTKGQILEAYINEIYLGQRGSVSIHGFGEASRFYFSKPLKATTVGEQSLLIGLIASPGRYSPFNSLERAKSRRDLVLRVLLENQVISNVNYELATKESILKGEKREKEFRAPFFLDYVRQELESRFPESALNNEGYEIYTTLDPFLQIAAHHAVGEGLKSLEKYMARKNKNLESQKKLEVAFISLSPQTGAIKAWMGGRNFEESQYNRVVQARRQPGSLIKPFVAATALSPMEDGKPVATAATVLDDSPATFSFAGKDWSPKNYEDIYGGKVTVRQAIERSLNVATINLAAQVGIRRLVTSFRSFGFDNVEEIPSLALGSIEASPFELARAYTIFSNGGLRVQPLGVSTVIDPKGQQLEQRSLKVDRVLSEEVAYLVTSLLQGVVERGTAVSVRKSWLTGELAGKTGTTDDYRDNWFVGFSPTLLTVVWIGYDDGTSTGMTGASTALQIWIRYMKEALKRMPEEKFTIPKKVKFTEIDRLIGCKGSTSEHFMEAFLPETEPPTCN